MHTVLLVSKSISHYKNAVEKKINEEITHTPVDGHIVDHLLEDYFNLMKISGSASFGTMKSSDETSVQVLRPDLESLERSVKRRKNVLEGGHETEIFESLKKYESIFSKHKREFQDFHYRVPEPFSSYSDEKIKRMLWIKLTSSFDFPLKRDIYKSRLYFVWNDDTEEYQILCKVPGLIKLSTVPFESYIVSIGTLSRPFLSIEIDSNDFFTLESHKPVVKNGIVTIRKKTLFASRRIDPKTEFNSKDVKFVKPILRQAIERSAKFFEVHSLLYGGLRCA
jgi:hypothetical protein